MPYRPQRLAELRHERGFTQRELGHRVGRSRSACRDWEAGLRNPPVLVLARLADALGVSPGEFFGESETEVQCVAAG